MRINNILFTVLLFSTLHSKSQTVTPVLVNVAQMVKYEEAHPELFRKCATCPRKEVDGGWKNIAEGLPIPVGAIIKTQQQPMAPMMQLQLYQMITQFLIIYNNCQK